MRMPVIAALCLAGTGVCVAQPAPVILISVDTLRADHLGAYGYRKIHTPNLDSFVQGGTLFSAIQSQIPLTLPSHTALFTSTYPFSNGVEENAERVPPSLTTLASVLHAHGYQTAAFVGSVILDRRTGIGQGFDLYDSPFHLPAGAAENPYAVRVRRDGALVIRSARQWLESHKGQAVFAFVHLFDLHTPYGLAPTTDAMPSFAGYDAELGYVDQLLGRFRQALLAGGWWDRALVILLSDHGESLGDHGESAHGYFVYQSTVWVPLIVHWPGGTTGRPGRVDQPGGLVDVAPTILDFLGIARPPSFQGRSLLEARAGAAYSETMYARDAFRWAPLRSLRMDHWQYIDAPKPELYSLQSDPGERTNALTGEPAEVAALRDGLRDLLAQFGAHAGPAGGRGEANKLLSSLGYLGVGPRAAGRGPAPDPKDRLPEYNLYEKGLATLYASRPAAAITTFLQVLKQDPLNAMARYYLGEAYFRAGQPARAQAEWTATLRQDPEYVPAEEALGELWLARQDYGRARGYFQQALAAAPEDVAALLGAAAAEDHLALTDQARKHRLAACSLEPDSAACSKR